MDIDWDKFIVDREILTPEEEAHLSKYEKAKLATLIERMASMANEAAIIMNAAEDRWKVANEKMLRAEGLWED